MGRNRTFLGVVVVAALLAGACGNAGGGDTPQDEAGPADATVTLKSLQFSPPTVTIQAGQTVRWKWDDGGVQHDVSGPGFKSKVQAKGQFDHTFDQAGTFEYVCTVHLPNMKGTVEVT